MTSLRALMQVTILHYMVNHSFIQQMVRKNLSSLMFNRDKYTNHGCQSSPCMHTMALDWAHFSHPEPSLSQPQCGNCETTGSFSLHVALLTLKARPDI